MFKSEIDQLYFKKNYSIKKKYSIDQKIHKILLQKLILCREVELKVSDLLNQGLIKTPCHLSLGQEAISAAIANLYSKNDSVFSTHRSHAHYLAFGNNVEKFFYELLGFKQGSSNGMGGSMHLYSNSPVKFHSLPIVGGTIPISLGSAFFYKRNKKKNIAYCFFGNGATEEGVFHESLNFASYLNLPIIFICENNLYSSHLDIKLRQPSDKISRFADSHKIKNEFVFGNNILDVYQSYKKAIKYVKTNNRPIFLEFLTYRLVGHVGPDKNIDVGVRRKKEDLIFWDKNDPINLYFDYLTRNKIFSKKYIILAQDKVRAEIDKILFKVRKTGIKPDSSFMSQFKRND